MQTEPIQIPVETQDKTGNVIGKLSGDINRLTKDITSSNKAQKMSLTELYSAYQLVTQGVQKFAQAAKAGYDFAKQGAQIEFTKVKFDRLAQTIGTTGDALLTKLRPATRGVMSDMELISSATDTMSLGLVRSEKDAIRLTTVMAGLGMDMNQVVLALSNQTTMRFDQLGVAVVGFDDKLKALKDTGMDANAAFTEAFLQQAEEQLQKVGHAADTTLGEMMQLESEWKNFVDSLKEGTAKGLGPSIAALNDYRAAAESVNEEVGSMPGMMRNQLAAMKAQTEAARENARITQMNVENWRAGEKQLSNLSQTAVTSSSILNQLKQSSQGYAASNMDLISITGTLQKETDAYNQKNAELQQTLSELVAEQRKYKEGGDMYNEIGGKIDETKEKIKELAKEHEMAGKQIAFSLLQAKLAVDGLSDAEFRALTEMGVQWGIFDQKTAESARNMDEQASIMAAAMQDPLNNAMLLAKSLQIISGYSGKPIKLLIDITTTGRIPEFTGTVGGGGGGGVQPNVSMQATGGTIGAGWTMVGEKGFELIGPNNRVYTHAQSVAMYKGGLRASRGFRVGGNVGDVDYDPTDVMVFGPTGSINALNSPLYQTTSGGGGGGGGNHGGSTLVSSVSAAVAEVAPAIVAEVESAVIGGISAQVSRQTVQLTQSVERMTTEQKKVVAKLDQLIAVVSTDNGVARAVVGQRSLWNG